MRYEVRAATLDDLDVLVRHRIAMFTEMGRQMDTAAIGAAFAVWLRQQMPGGAYRAWLVDAIDGGARRIVAGGGATVIPWPPGPQYAGDRLAFVYNVYTDAEHRRQGLARLVMEAIHEWCAANGVGSIALNASDDGRRLYETLGYVVTPSPMMFFSVVKV